MDNKSEIFEQIDDTYRTITDRLQNINLEQAGVAAGEILNLVAKFLQDGKADKALSRTVLLGGNVAKSIGTEMVLAHRDITKAAIVAFERITAILEDDFNEDATDLIKHEWMKVAMANPIDAIKFKKSVKNLKKALGIGVVDKHAEMASFIHGLADEMRDVMEDIKEQEDFREEQQAEVAAMFDEFVRTGGKVEDLKVVDGQIVIDKVQPIVTSHQVPKDKKPVKKAAVKKAAPKKVTKRSGKK